jgi:lipopolysaccharide O-acetyltransferase
MNRSDVVHNMVRYLRNNGLFHFSGLIVEILRNHIHSYFLGRKLGAAGLLVRSGYYIRGLPYMHIGKNFHAGRGLWLEAVTQCQGQNFSPVIEIGDNVSISFWGHIAAAKLITIGSGVMIGSKVTIIDHDHGGYGSGMNVSPDIPPSQRLLSVASVRIGSNVWIADGVVVTAGAEIGEGSVIGANSVVRGYIPPFTLAVGVPARPIKKFDFVRREWARISDRSDNRSS